MGLAELFVALAILLIGLTALLQLCLASAYTNNKNSKDTSATLLAQMVLEQVSAQHPDSTATITLTDCANVAHTVATAGGTAPNGLGANVDTNAADLTYGMICWSPTRERVGCGGAVPGKQLHCQRRKRRFGKRSQQRLDAAGGASCVSSSACPCPAAANKQRELHLHHKLGSGIIRKHQS
jgi:hypothetical protein